jgi:hypothetical protein
MWGGYFKTYNAAMRAARPVFDEFKEKMTAANSVDPRTLGAPAADLPSQPNIGAVTQSQAGD